MTKNKIMRYFKKAVASTLAIATSFGGVVSANMVTTFAADAKLDNDVKITAKKLKYDDTESYVSKNINKKMASIKSSKSVANIKNDLEQTGYTIRLKQLLAEESKIPSNCTIDELWTKHSDAFLSQYTSIIPVYQANDNADYYVVNLAASKINHTGKLYDAAFVKGTDNANPDVIKDIKFDKTTGLAYIPKSYFEKDKNVLITGQVMSAGSIKDQTMSIDTIVDNGGNITKQAVEANTYDVTVKIPITTSKRVADKLKLSDFEVYLNGSEDAMDLTKDTAVFDKTTGVLEIAASPASLTSVKVKIKKIGALKSVARLLTNDVSASISGASKLKFVTDKKTGDPIVFDRIDTSKLQDGQYFEYKTAIRYFSDIKDTQVNYNAKACAESIRHSIKYLYVPSEDNDAWSQLYNNSSIKDPQAKKDLENVTFGMTLPNYNDYKYQVTAKNGNKAKLNFHQKGSFVTTYTNDDSDEKKGSTYSSRHMYAGECAHISNPMGEFNDKEDGKVRLRILHVDTSAGYVVFGLNSQKINTQSGFGIYKVAIQSKGSLKLKKTSANTTMTNGNSCYSLANAEYGVYTEKACTNKVATLKTDANGNSKVVEVDAGTYYVKGARRFLINERS